MVRVGTACFIISETSSGVNKRSFFGWLVCPAAAPAEAEAKGWPSFIYSVVILAITVNFCAIRDSKIVRVAKGGRQGLYLI